MVEYTGWNDYLQMKDRDFEDEFNRWQEKHDDKEPPSFGYKALEKRVRDIETWIPDVEDIREHEKRIKDLEEKWDVLDGVDRDSHKRLTTLEAHDEQWRKTNAYKRITDLENHDSYLTVNELLRISEEHNKRIKDIESIVKPSDCGTSTVQGKESSAYVVPDNLKVIDKQVWKEIVSRTSLLNNHRSKTDQPYSPTNININALVETIKKIDPEWCPND